MVNIMLDLTKDEIAMPILCIDSALGVVEFTEEERERAEQLKEQLTDYLE
jgi:hypothetical protein